MIQASIMVIKTSISVHQKKFQFYTGGFQFSFNSTGRQKLQETILISTSFQGLPPMEATCKLDS